MQNGLCIIELLVVDRLCLPKCTMVALCDHRRTCLYLRVAEEAIFAEFDETFSHPTYLGNKNN